MSHNVVFWNDVYSSSQAERWSFWGKNAFCLTFHWCYQTAQPPTAPRDLQISADLDVWWIFLLFPFLLFLPPGWIIECDVFVDGCPLRAWVTRREELQSRDVVRLLFLQTFFFRMHFWWWGWEGRLMQEVIRLTSVLTFLKSTYTLKWPHGTAHSRYPQISQIECCSPQYLNYLS